MTKKINIIGIGGASKVLAKFTKNKNLFAIETNSKTLDSLPDHITKIQFGDGSGSGANPEYAKSLFDPSKVESIFDCDLLILIAGLGGGTGSGITPELAKIAKDKQILSKLILFSPLDSEGAKQNSNKILEEMKNLELPITLIDNQTIFDKAPNLKMSDIYNLADFGAIETVKTLENILSSQDIDYKDIAKSFIDGFTYSNSVRGEDFDKAFYNLEKSTLIDPKTLSNSKHFLLTVKGDITKQEFETIQNFTKFIQTNTKANFKFSLDNSEKDFEISMFVSGITDKPAIDEDYSKIVSQKQSDYKADYISEVRSQSAKKANNS